MTMPAGFSTNILSLVDRGFVYAIAHVRGGKDKGYRWYKDGKREKKMNTFTDFIAAGEPLRAERYTSRGPHRRPRRQRRRHADGRRRQHGARAVRRHHRRGAVRRCAHTPCSTTRLPLTPPEWPEWGNPIESEADYKTIAAYSPYDNVAGAAYPPILAVAGLTDPRA